MKNKPIPISREFLKLSFDHLSNPELLKEIVLNHDDAQRRMIIALRIKLDRAQRRIKRMNETIEDYYYNIREASEI